MTICKKRLAPLALALLLAFGLTVGAAPVSADAANEHVIEFLDVIGPMASADMQQNGILASLTIAQAMWESTYGQSPLAVNANNLFGIKAYSSWDGMVYCSANGTLYTSYQEAKSILGESFMNTYKEKFWRAYSSWQESVNDHSNLFNTADRYENLRGLTDYKLACQYVVEDGYCSDPGYAENLIRLIEDYELYRYDVGDVDPGEVTRVALSESNITLRVGQSFSLEASVYPATAADKSVTWSSSDTSVATVSDGLVSAKKLGAANITATSKNGKTATCTVLVADDSGSLTLDKTALTLALGGVFIMTGKMDAVDLITFSLYVSVFISPIRKLTQFVEQFQKGSSGFLRFLEIMRAEPDVKDAPDAKELTNCRGEIDVDHVSFSYEGTEGEGVLHDVSVHVTPGEMLAIVGPSGGGKSTLCQLIPRFYEVSDGAIRIDGEDVRALTQTSLHRAIGVVQQDVFLFADTVRENSGLSYPCAKARKAS